MHTLFGISLVLNSHNTQAQFLSLPGATERTEVPPLKILIMAIENGQGGEDLSLVHWLSYENLNLCMFWDIHSDRLSVGIE